MHLLVEMCKAGDGLGSHYIYILNVTIICGVLVGEKEGLF